MGGPGLVFGAGELDHVGVMDLAEDERLAFDGDDSRRVRPGLDGDQPLGVRVDRDRDGAVVGVQVLGPVLVTVSGVLHRPVLGPSSSFD